MSTLNAVVPVLAVIAIAIGIFMGFVGMMWRMWDKGAIGPGWWIGIALVLVLAGSSFARDLDGRYAQSPLKQWFDGLKSGKGPCCSDADGSAISDADWERTNDGKHYRVRIPGNDGKPAWIDVPDEAVITEPNLAGKTMVWPIRGYLGVSIRCFMPGVMI